MNFYTSITHHDLCIYKRLIDNLHPFLSKVCRGSHFIMAGITGETLNKKSQLPEGYYLDLSTAQCQLSSEEQTHFFSRWTEDLSWWCPALYLKEWDKLPWLEQQLNQIQRYGYDVWLLEFQTYIQNHSTLTSSYDDNIQMALDFVEQLPRFDTETSLMI